MQRVCAWCKTDLGPSTSEDQDSELITHGICESCAIEMYRGLSTSLRSFLDSFDQPILLVGPDPKVLTGNTAAQRLLKKDLEDIEGFKGGEVINCEHAYSEQGCGEDIHCESCTIRNTVLKTFATGKSHREVPAYPDIQRVSGARNHSVRVSTEKVGEVVLLRIDEMAETAPSAEPQND